MGDRYTEEQIYDYLCENFKNNQPIFLSKVTIEGLKSQSVRYYMNKMAEEKRIGKFDSGTFYLPQKDLFGNPAPLSSRSVVEAKYVKENKNIIGFYSGNTFANYIGISNQVPVVKEICSNNATAPVRTVSIGNQKIITRRPLVKITNENHNTIRFLDCLKDLESTADREPEACRQPLSDYCKAYKITKEDIDQYISSFPDKVYKIIYQTKVEFYVPA